MDEKIKYIMESNEIRNKLCKMGICPVVGPTGPKGEKGDIGPVGEAGISHEFIVDETKTINPDEPAKVQDEFNSNTHHLTFYIPKGEKGDQGEIGPVGPKGEDGGATIEVGKTETVDSTSLAEVTNVGNNKDVILNFKIPKGEKGETGPQGEKGETGPRGFPGEIGISEVITIDGTETVEADEQAEVQDDFDRNIHHLTFYIPKGEKGEKGDQGEVGPTGPMGSLGPTSYDVIAFVSYPNTTVAGIALTGASRIIPGITNKISMEGSNSIKINQSGLYEITVCGRISGVTKDIGGAFYLIKSETSEVLTDMSFILSKGNTEDMDFSEISFVDITAPATLQLKTEIDGDTATSNIEFSSINVLIKGYSV